MVLKPAGPFQCWPHQIEIDELEHVLDRHCLVQSFNRVLPLGYRQAANVQIVCKLDEALRPLVRCRRDRSGDRPGSDRQPQQLGHGDGADHARHDLASRQGDRWLAHESAPLRLVKETRSRGRLRRLAIIDPRVVVPDAELARPGENFRSGIHECCR